MEKKISTWAEFVSDLGTGPQLYIHSLMPQHATCHGPARVWEGAPRVGVWI